MRNLPFARIEVVVVLLEHDPRHRAVGDIEQPVKVQSVLFGTSFPYAYILPAPSGTEIAQRAFQSLSETAFAVEPSVVGKRRKVVEIL